MGTSSLNERFSGKLNNDVKFFEVVKFKWNIAIIIDISCLIMSFNKII